MQVWKKSLLGAALSLAMVGGVVTQVGAQEPASLTAYVSLCSADLTQCEVVNTMNVYFTVNNNPEQVVPTNANGEASIEVSTGDEVTITVDPSGIQGASISPESQAGYVIPSVTGSEETFNFIFIEDAKPTTTTTATTATATSNLPATGVGPMQSTGINGTLLLVAVGSAVAAGAAGVALRRRSADLR